MYEALLLIYLLTSVSIVGLVLLQQGKGADIGASFGAGVSTTLFGSTGSSGFMVRMTAGLAALFFTLSLILGNLNASRVQNSQWRNLSQPLPAEVRVEPTDLAEQSTE